MEYQVRVGLFYQGSPLHSTPMEPLQPQPLPHPPCHEALIIILPHTSMSLITLLFLLAPPTPWQVVLETVPWKTWTISPRPPLRQPPSAPVFLWPVASLVFLPPLLRTGIPRARIGFSRRPMPRHAPADVIDPDSWGANLVSLVVATLHATGPITCLWSCSGHGA